MPGKNWYIIKVKTGDEEKLILKANKLPQTKWFVIKKQKFTNKNHVRQLEIRSMFPGYVFVESVLDQKKFSILVQTFKQKQGVSMNELRYDLEDTSALSVEEQKMIQRLAGNDYVVEHSIGFIENDHVVITQGPLIGLESNISYIDRHKKMAKLKLHLFNDEKEVSVSLEIISKI